MKKTSDYRGINSYINEGHFFVHWYKAGHFPDMRWKGNKMLEIYLAMLDSEEDKNKLEQLYANYKQFMYKTVYTILKNATDAEDAVHEAFMRVIRCM